MSTFDKRDIPELSLDAIKTAIKVAKATSPERNVLINDLEYIADTIENKKSQAIACNRTICAKHPAIFDVAGRYQLCRISDEQAMQMPQEEQIMVLHRIAHYIKGLLTSATIKVKGQVLVEEVGKSALGYAAKQLLSE